MIESTDDDDRSVEVSSDDVQMVDLGNAKKETKQYFPGGQIRDSQMQYGWF